ncbi:hypothetical protein ACF09Y_02875 [Streptomyces massasporeus]|uniref:hypothetical protein n=1 Tax=Streptomyces massasporeus TaxID=67324 RepID=UPI00370310DC
MLDSKPQSRLVTGLILLILTGPFVVYRMDWGTAGILWLVIWGAVVGVLAYPPQHCGIGSPPTGEDRPAETGKPGRTIRRVRLEAPLPGYGAHRADLLNLSGFSVLSVLGAG